MPKKLYIYIIFKFINYLHHLLLNNMTSSVEVRSDSSWSFQQGVAFWRTQHFKRKFKMTRMLCCAELETLSTLWTCASGLFCRCDRGRGCDSAWFGHPRGTCSGLDCRKPLLDRQQLGSDWGGQAEWANENDFDCRWHGAPTSAGCRPRTGVCISLILNLPQPNFLSSQSVFLFHIPFSNVHNSKSKLVLFLFYHNLFS